MRLALAILLLSTLSLTVLGQTGQSGVNPAGQPQPALPDIELPCNESALRLLLTNSEGIKYKPSGEMASIISHIVVKLRDPITNEELAVGPQNNQAIEEILEILHQARSGSYVPPSQRQARTEASIRAELLQSMAQRPQGDAGTQPQNPADNFNNAGQNPGGAGFGMGPAGNPTGNPLSNWNANSNPNGNRTSSILTEKGIGTGPFSMPGQNGNTGNGSATPLLPTGQNAGPASGSGFGTGFPLQSQPNQNAFPAPNSPNRAIDPGASTAQPIGNGMAPMGQLPPRTVNSNPYGGTPDPTNPGQGNNGWNGIPSNAVAGTGSIEMQRMMEQLYLMKNQMANQEVQLNDMKLENATLRYQNQGNRMASLENNGNSGMIPAGTTEDKFGVGGMNNGQDARFADGRPRMAQNPSGAVLAAIPGELTSETLSESNRRLSAQNLFLILMLLASVGLNIYLSMIARGLYVRYGDLADELRDTFSAAA